MPPPSLLYLCKIVLTNPVTLHHCLAFFQALALSAVSLFSVLLMVPVLSS